MSKDEDENKIVNTWGDVKQHKALSHVDLCAMIDGYDPIRGAKVSGSRGYFLKVIRTLVLKFKLYFSVIMTKRLCQNLISK